MQKRDTWAIKYLDLRILARGYTDWQVAFPMPMPYGISDAHLHFEQLSLLSKPWCLSYHWNFARGHADWWPLSQCHIALHKWPGYQYSSLIIIQHQSPNQVIVPSSISYTISPFESAIRELEISQLIIMRSKSHQSLGCGQFFPGVPLTAGSLTQWTILVVYNKTHRQL